LVFEKKREQFLTKIEVYCCLGFLNLPDIKMAKDEMNDQICLLVEMKLNKHILSGNVVPCYWLPVGGWEGHKRLTLHVSRSIK